MKIQMYATRLLRDFSARERCAFVRCNRMRAAPITVTGYQIQAFHTSKFARTNTMPSQHGPRNASRMILYTSFAACLGYLVGVGDMSWFTRQKKKPSAAEPTYADTNEMEKAISEIEQLLGEDAVTKDDEELHRHGFSEWSSHNTDRLPVAVVYPKSTSDVSNIAKICYKYRVPITPFAGGTSLEANFSAPYGGVSVDFAFMNEILAVHKDDMDVVVQPSVPWMTLNEQLKDTGLFFPVDPGPTAQIGGMLSTRCSGTNAVRYGTMKDWVINLTVVKADGTVIKTRRRPRKSSAGYDLTSLFVGSEGTLGLVTEITLKLAVIPQETSVAVVTFPTIRAAAAAASEIMRAGVPIAAMEIMDEVQMKVVNTAGSTGKTWEEVPTMFFKFSGTSAGVKDNIEMVKRIAKQNKCKEFEFAMDEQQKQNLWSARKESLWSMLAMRQDDAQDVWSTDVAVPFSKLPELIEITKDDIDGLNIFASALGHVGDGNFHTSILYNRNDPEQRARVEACVGRMIDRALEMEGTCTGEHGIGIGKKEELLKELGVDTVETMKTVKRALDPRLILNPGKVFDFS